jgi:hypothetical protein
MNGSSDDSMSRDDLWRRLERLNYFDWCRKAEYKQLRALFFDGEVVDYPEEFISCRELFWSPKQGEEHWRATIEARKAYLDFEGQRQVAERRGEKFVARAIDSLLQSDFQYVGMDVTQQLALLNCLGIENRDRGHGQIYMQTWSSSIRFWLKGIAHEGRLELSNTADCPSAHRRHFFYELLALAPVEVRNGEVVLPNEVRGWSDSDAELLGFGLAELCKLLVKYRLPEGLQCNTAPRMNFVEAALEDLESGSVPEVFQQMWHSTLAGQKN